MILDNHSLGIINDGYEYVEWDLFDTLTLPGGYVTASSYRMFDKPISYNKSEYETNMFIGCMLPAPQRFIINSIICICNRFRTEVQKRASELVWDNASLVLQIGQKYQFNTPLARFPLNSDYQTLWTKKGRKWVLPRPVYFAKHKPMILSQQYFVVYIKMPNLALDSDVKIKVILSGELARGVQ